MYRGALALALALASDSGSYSDSVSDSVSDADSDSASAPAYALTTARRANFPRLGASESESESESVTPPPRARAGRVWPKGPRLCVRRPCDRFGAKGRGDWLDGRGCRRMACRVGLRRDILRLDTVRQDMVGVFLLLGT
jgi:hypothetical protein